MAAYPYQVHIVPSDIPYASSGTWTLAVDSSMLGGMKLECDNVQNNYIEWPVLCAQGTYRLTVVVERSGFRGIATVTIDGVSIGTIDFYGSSTENTVYQLSGVAIAAGNHLLRFTMATKSGSSGSYAATLQHVALLRVSA